jgi:hypothetical protein
VNTPRHRMGNTAGPALGYLRMLVFEQFGTGETHRLNGVPGCPGVCVLLTAAQAAAGEFALPDLSLAMAVTH